MQYSTLRHPSHRVYTSLISLHESSVYDYNVNIQIQTKHPLTLQDADSESLAAVKQQLEADNKKLRKVRLLLGKKNREISSLQWQIDDVPSRAELSQYQRRFIELYNQVPYSLQIFRLPLFFASRF